MKWMKNYFEVNKLINLETKLNILINYHTDWLDYDDKNDT